MHGMIQARLPLMIVIMIIFFLLFLCREGKVKFKTE